MFSMRKSRVLKKLRAGEVVTCFKNNLTDARATELACLYGFDCIWTCTEHVACDWSQIEKQIYAAKCYDVDMVCRVSRGGYSDYIKPLELDATGIMVPHIMSLKDAQSIVRMTRFHPVGRRPMDGGNQDGLYCNIAAKDYIEQANRERFVILQIEDPEPIEELEAIVKLPGYDILFLGPGDLSHSLGVTGEINDPRIVEVRKRIGDLCRKHGKFAGTVGSPATFRDLVNMGYQFINLGADVRGIAEYCAAIAQACGLKPTSRTVSIY